MSILGRDPASDPNHRFVAEIFLKIWQKQQKYYVNTLKIWQEPNKFHDWKLPKITYTIYRLLPCVVRKNVLSIGDYPIYTRDCEKIIIHTLSCLGLIKIFTGCVKGQGGPWGRQIAQNLSGESRKKVEEVLTFSYSFAIGALVLKIQISKRTGTIR